MSNNDRWGKLRAYWRRPAVRVLTALAVAAVAGVVQYRLARNPLPVEVSDTKKVSIPPIRSGEKLIISGLVASTQSPLFAYRGSANEVVDIHLEQASISPEALANYQLNPGFESVDHIAYTTQRPGVSTGVCTTDVEAVASVNTPTRIVLFQSEGPGNQIYRNLAIEMDRDVLINVTTNPPAGPATDTDDDGPGCVKLLAGRNHKHRLEGGVLMTSRLLPNARLDLRILSLNPNVPIWNGADSVSEPLQFKSPIFEADKISINYPNGSAAFEAASSSPDQPLRVNRLKIASDVLLTEISGIGLVKVRGEPITLSVFERIREYPLFATLFLAFNGALATWLLKQVSSLFKTEPRRQPKKKRGKQG